MSGLEIDFETRSDIDIRQAGVYRYMASPYTEPLFASYQINDGPLKRWHVGEPCPPDIVAHVEAGGTVSAHNNVFERLLWQRILTPRHGWPTLRLEQCRCTAATAAGMSLPRDLEKLGAALDLPVKKDKEGKRLINKFSKPRPVRKGEAPGIYFRTAEEEPEDYAKFRDYCDDDVRAEAGADRRMIPLSAYEQNMWVIDQRINDRGIRIDTKSARAALRLAEKAKRLLDRQMNEATNGAVTACTQVENIVEWVQAQGVALDSAAKADIEDLLEHDDLPAHVRRVLLLRQEAAKTSVSKLTAFLKRAGDDGRIRGAFLFNAAGTGRWSSVGAQLHNLPRPRKVYGDLAEKHKLDLHTLFDQGVRNESPEYLKFLYGDELGKPLHLISDSLRSFIWAAPGHELVVADYSGIEGAVAAWFAGEKWKLEAMFALIADPSLPDLYRRSAAGIFNTTTDLLTKKDPRRQIGKVSELSLQYQGGVGAFRSMARNYSLKIEPVFAPVWEAADDERREKAEKRYETCVMRGESMTKLLNRKEWLAAELIKVGWRHTHPAICDAWKLLEQGIREAIENPGRHVEVLKCTYLVSRGFLWCRLPSGRCLAYGKPRLKDQVWVRRKGLDASEVMAKDIAEHLERKGELSIESHAKPAATALGVDSTTKQWVRFALYGGLTFENIVQAIARDILAHGIKQAEGAGYPVIGHVHDEIICELLRGFGDVGFFEKLICDLPSEYDGLPLTAIGWSGKRYKKD